MIAGLIDEAAMLSAVGVLITQDNTKSTAISDDRPCELNFNFSAFVIL